MQILGRAISIKLEDVKTQALEISKESGFLCVYEKAKHKTTSDDPPSGRYLVCYRLWLDRDRSVNEPTIMDIKDWTPKESPKDTKPVKHITQLHMRENRTNPFYKQGRF